MSSESGELELSLIAMDRVVALEHTTPPTADELFSSDSSCFFCFSERAWGAPGGDEAECLHTWRCHHEFETSKPGVARSNLLHIHITNKHALLSLKKSRKSQKVENFTHLT
jgi:hypothetical protein